MEKNLNSPWNKKYFWSGKSTLFSMFSKRSAFWYPPNLLVTLGHWLWLQDILTLSNGIGSNMLKTLFEHFWHWVFCHLLSRWFDKIKMIWVGGRWPRGRESRMIFMYKKFREECTEKRKSHKRSQLTWLIYHQWSKIDQKYDKINHETKMFTGKGTDDD